MSIVSSPLVLLNMTSGLISIGVFSYIWIHREKYTSSTSFIFLILGIIIWTFSYGFGLIIFDLQIRRLFEIPAWIGRVIIPVAWIIFALEYTGRDEFISKKVLILISVIPLLTIIISIFSIWSQEFYNLMWINYKVVESFEAATVEYTPGIWMILQTIYAWILILSGMVIFLGIGFVQSHNKLYTKQSILLILSALLPTAMSFKWLYNIGPFPEIDFTPITLSITGVTFAYALFHHGLLTRVPAIHKAGWKNAIDDFGDSILILDKEKSIIDMNKKAEKIFQCRLEDKIKKPLDNLIESGSIEFDKQKQFFRYESDEGVREFNLTISTLEQYNRNVMGYMLSFHDVTEERLRKQRLEVLNRVLRHNLRNQMNSILLYSQIIKRQKNKDKSEIAEKIEKNAKELIEISKEVREIENFVADKRNKNEKIELNKLFQSIKNEIEEKYKKVDISINSERENIYLRSDKKILRKVFFNVIENAVEHNTSDIPEVDISVHLIEEKWIEINITDNGPGIPKEEISVIEEEAETQLKHGSSLGLWLIKWGVNLVGGDLEFKQKNPSGTIVTIRIPGLSQK